MSLLIKKMEMPMQCVSCKLWTMQIIGGKGYDICRAADKVIKNPYGRQDFCPLEEHPKGQWLELDDCMTVCSVCGSLGCGSNFCPNCGADMRGDIDV